VEQIGPRYWIQVIAKRIFIVIADRLVGVNLFGRFIDELILAAMRRLTIVNHGNVTIEFAVPNRLCEYRALSFSSKEPETLRWLDEMPDGTVFWDVGANVGLYSIYAALGRSASVVAIEPSVFNLEILARNIAANKIENSIMIIPLPVSDTEGTNFFNMSNTLWGGALSSFGKEFDQNGNHFTPAFKYQTLGFTIDQLVFEFGLPQPTYLKIDVDGIEHLILSGARKVLDNVESILIELDRSFTIQVNQASDHLREAGFSLVNSDDLSLKGQSNQIWKRDVRV
jgi:FkbM family methyltransferase